jgi:hypothetical protein
MTRLEHVALISRHAGGHPEVVWSREGFPAAALEKP